VWLWQARRRTDSENAGGRLGLGESDEQLVVNEH
jgi:hypothetical protein